MTKIVQIKQFVGKNQRIVTAKLNFNPIFMINIYLITCVYIFSTSYIFFE